MRPLRQSHVALGAQVDETGIDQAADAGSVGMFVEIAQHQDAVPDVSLDDASQLLEPGVPRRDPAIGVMIEYTQSPPACADCDLEDDARLRRRGGVEPVSSDFRQRPSRKDGKAVVSFVPFDAGGEDVMETQGSGQGRRLVDETGATHADVDLLQGDDIGLHVLQFGGDRVQRRRPRGADVPCRDARAFRRISNRHVTGAAGSKWRMGEKVGRLRGDANLASRHLGGRNTILSGSDGSHTHRKRRDQ